MARRRRVNPYRDRKIFTKTARKNVKNIPGHAAPRGGEVL